MNIQMEANYWLEIERKGDDLILSTAETNGNTIELHFKKNSWLHKRWLRQFIKDLQKEIDTESGGKE